MERPGRLSSVRASDDYARKPGVGFQLDRLKSLGDHCARGDAAGEALPQDLRSCGPSLRVRVIEVGKGLVRHFNSFRFGADHRTVETVSTWLLRSPTSMNGEGREKPVASRAPLFEPLDSHRESLG